MNKIMHVFSLVFVFMFSWVFPIGDQPLPEIKPKVDLEKYRLYVTKVDPEFHCFELSNKRVCYTLEKNWEKEELPAAGAEIVLFPRIRHEGEKGEFICGYSRDDEKRHLIVGMSLESTEYCLSYVLTKPVVVQPAGWFSSAVYEDVVELSDGSRWTIQDDQKFGEFKEGDTIVVSYFDENQWTIMNIDRTFSPFRCKCLKRKEMHSFVIVKPFN